MHTYSYTALLPSHAIESGEISARSKNDAVELLRKKNLREISVWTPIEKMYSLFLATIRHVNIPLLISQLSSLMTMGVPPARALEFLAAKFEHWKIRKLLGCVRAKVDDTGVLSEALAMYPLYFDTFMIAVLQSGEKNGQLNQTLVKLARSTERTCGILQKVKAALLYPTLFGIMAFLVMTMLFMLFIPRFTHIFTAFQVPIAQNTRLLLIASAWLRCHFLPVIITFFAIFIAIHLFSRFKAIRSLYVHIIHHIPFLSDIRRKLLISNFLNKSSLLRSCGFSIKDSILITSYSMISLQARSAINIQSALQHPTSDFVQILRNTGLFPEMLLQLLVNNGDTEYTLMQIEKISQYYTEEVEAIIDAFTVIAEPGIIFVISFIVASILLTMYAPILALK